MYRLLCCCKQQACMWQCRQNFITCYVLQLDQVYKCVKHTHTIVKINLHNKLQTRYATNAGK